MRTAISQSFLAESSPHITMCTNAHSGVSMADSSTVTIRLSNHAKEQLAELADRTRRSRSFLAAEAISAYVERELSIIEKVERGRADVRAERTTPHDEVMAKAKKHLSPEMTA